MPKRIQWSRFGGKPLPPNTKLVTRPSRWGNPYVVGRSGNREEVVEMFRVLVRDRSGMREAISYPSPEDIRRDLGGYDLACSCDHSGPCHGDELIAIANGDQS